MFAGLQETIVAVASASGGAARGIIRLSGPEVGRCLSECYVLADGMSFDSIAHAQVLPGELILSAHARLPGELYFWPTNKSYTREPAAEFHTLGSPPLLAAAVAAFCAAGARLAEPGEFTLRSFLAGRIDLTQAEAVLGVVDAAGQAELALALAQLAGGLAAPLALLRERLLNLLAHLEAGLDFVEEDIEFISAAELQAQLVGAMNDVDQLARRMTARGAEQGALRIALIGAPNVGKSSLLNALVGQDKAIVSSRAGTTRDFVSVRENLDGLDCVLVDTAGVEQQPEGCGIIVASQAISNSQRETAHLRLLCLDSTRPLDEWEVTELARAETSERRLVVLTKCDIALATDFAGTAIKTSSRTGTGLAELRCAIRNWAACEANAFSVVSSTADRCRESLRLAAECLSKATLAADTAAGEELVAVEVRLALDELGKVAGVVHTDDVLDRVFSRFCIGK